LQELEAEMDSKSDENILAFKSLLHLRFRLHKRLFLTSKVLFLGLFVAFKEVLSSILNFGMDLK